MFAPGHRVAGGAWAFSPVGDGANIVTDRTGVNLQRVGRAAGAATGMGAKPPFGAPRPVPGIPQSRRSNSRDNPMSLCEESNVQIQSPPPGGSYGGEAG